MPSIEQSPRPHSAGKSVNFEGGGAGAGGSGAQGVRLLGLLPCQKKANDLAAILRRMQAQMTGGIVAAHAAGDAFAAVVAVARVLLRAGLQNTAGVKMQPGENGLAQAVLPTFRQQMDLLGQLAPVGGPSTGAEQHQWPLTGSP